MTDLATAALAAVGGALTALAPVGIAWLRRRGSNELAETRHDERVSPMLMERIEKLETRVDERDEVIRKHQDEINECQRDREECQRLYGEAKEAIGELRGIIERRDEDVTRRVRVAVREEIRTKSTPPGAWKLGEEPED